jgi:hypothetical protein
MFVRAAEAFANLRELFRRDVLKDEDLQPVERIAAVAVWDTVGAMGVPSYKNNERLDRYRFANTRLSEKVTMGFHAVALDEQRVDFSPTLWERASNVTQALFPGAHADVGGGYKNNAEESGLSNVALRWMIEQLRNAGVQFTAADVNALVPEVGAWAHQPWEHGVWKKMPTHSRGFPAGTGEHPSIAERMTVPGVVAEPDEPPAPYRPANRPAA